LNILRLLNDVHKLLIQDFILVFDICPGLRHVGVVVKMG